MISLVLSSPDLPESKIATSRPYTTRRNWPGFSLRKEVNSTTKPLPAFSATPATRGSVAGWTQSSLQAAGGHCARFFWSSPLASTGFS